MWCWKETNALNFLQGKETKKVGSCLFYFNLFAIVKKLCLMLFSMVLEGTTYVEFIFEFLKLFSGVMLLLNFVIDN